MHHRNWKRVRSHTPNEVTGRSYKKMRAAGPSQTQLGYQQSACEAEPVKSSTTCWYAVYTRSRHEKAVAEQLLGKGVETFLPLYRTLRRWKNGDHTVDLPLFPGYAFARFALADRLPVLKVPGVVRLVGFNGVPVALEDHEVDDLRQALAAGVTARPHPYLTEGCRVRITAGPLAGRRGILVRRQGTVRVVLSIDLIQRSVLVDVAADSLERA
ncbi:MAG TPA: UpxY family transcription antiterminator [Terriglobia bacterium]|nr:UpxY family transcription antiterminator [Terriglobia bacterium]